MPKKSAPLRGEGPLSQEVQVQTKPLVEGMDDVDVYRQMQQDPIFFVKVMYGLEPQRVKAEYKETLFEARREQDYTDIRLSMFEEYEKGKHITRQQHEILLSIKRAISNKSSKKITVRSGHGIGKTAIMSIVIIWFLFCFMDAQVPCTAPTSYQINDVLWKEISIWISKLPTGYKDLFLYQKGYLRIAERQSTWFARARPGDKENPEALAGVHADHVLLMADEASGVDEEVFNSAKGALTSENTLFIMISNPTRLEGYFYKSHTELASHFQKLNFSGIESPIVSQAYVDEILEENGEDSDEYRYRVLGLFPKIEGIDEKGYLPLVMQKDLRRTKDLSDIPLAYDRMGVDPSGLGRDETLRMGRNSFLAEVIGVEKTSTDKSIASKTLTLMMHNEKIMDRFIYIDNFGVGANVGVELAYEGHRVTCQNWALHADDQDKFANKRAECYRRVRERILSGGELMDNEITRKKMKDLVMIKYKRDNRGRIVIMPKDEMRKQYGKSPDGPDALALTFWDKTSTKKPEQTQKVIYSKITGKQIAGGVQRPNHINNQTTLLFKTSIK